MYPCETPGTSTLCNTINGVLITESWHTYEMTFPIIANTDIESGLRRPFCLCLPPVKRGHYTQRYPQNVRKGRKFNRWASFLRNPCWPLQLDLRLSSKDYTLGGLLVPVLLRGSVWNSFFAPHKLCTYTRCLSECAIVDRYLSNLKTNITEIQPCQDSMAESLTLRAISGWNDTNLFQF